MSIKLAATYGTRAHVVAVETIRHPMADEISIALGDNGYCDFPYSVELAFFKKGEWVTDILPEFAAFASGPSGDTLVYARVPVLDFAQFITNYGGNK